MKRSRSQANIIVTAEPAGKKKRSSKRTRIQKWPLNGVAATARAKLRYSCEISLASSGTTVVARHNFAVNNLYDPDSTGAGAQPLGFDQWMTLYGLYTVVGGKITVNPITSGSSTTTPQYYALACGDTSYPLSTTQAFISSCPSSNPGQPHSDLGIHRGALSTEYIKERARTVKWTAGGIMGMPQSQVIDRTSLQGNASSGPADLVYCTLVVADVASAASSTNYYRVTIEFDTIFTNPLQFSNMS